MTTTNTNTWAVIVCPDNVTNNHLAWSRTSYFDTYDDARSYADSCYGSCDSVIFIGTTDDANRIWEESNE